jgi:thiamine transport system permease protein
MNNLFFYLCAALVVAFFAGMMLYPSWQLWQHELAATQAHQWILSAYFQTRYARTLLQATLSVGLVALLALPMSYALTHYDFWGKQALLRYLLLPFLTPVLLLALSLKHWPFAPDNGLPLMLYGHAFFNIPLVVLAGLQGIRAVPRHQLMAAASLGLTPSLIFKAILWPTMRPLVLAALCLVFLYCFSSFSLSLLLGGRDYATIDVEIYRLISGELNLGLAKILSVYSFGLTLCVMLAYAYFSRVSYQVAANLGHQMTQPLAPLPKDFRVFFGIFFCFLGWPLIFVLAQIWHYRSGFWDSLSAETTLLALYNTLIFTGAALILASFVGVVQALCLQKNPALRALNYLPFMLSPIVLALGLLVAYPQAVSQGVVLVLAYALFASPFITSAVTHSLETLPRARLAATRTLGQPPWRCFWRVIVPHCWPYFAQGLRFAAATCLGEFAASLFFANPDYLTLNTLIYQHLGQVGEFHLARAWHLSTLLLLAALCLGGQNRKNEKHFA